MSQRGRSVWRCMPECLVSLCDPDNLLAGPHRESPWTRANRVASTKNLSRDGVTKATMAETLGSFPLNRVAGGDCLDLAALLPDESIDLVVTSPPYWGQR